MSKLSVLQKALRKEAENSNNNFLPFFKFPEGYADIRILPASKQDQPDEWLVPTGSHYNLDPKKPVGCRAETNWAQEDCPVCEAVRELQSNGMDEEAKKYRVRRQYVVRGIVRGEEDKGPQFIRLPVTLFKQIGVIIEDEDTWGDVLSPGPKGRDIRVIKTGQGLNTKYQAQALPKNRPILDSKIAVKEILEGLGPISELAPIPTEGELAKLVKQQLGFSASTLGTSVDDEDFDDDEDGWGDTEDEVGDDTPFDDDDASEEADEAEESSDTVGDDDWLDDEDDDGESEATPEDILRVQAETAAKKKGTKISGLTEGLGDELGKKHKVKK